MEKQAYYVTYQTGRKKRSCFGPKPNGHLAR